MPRNADGTPICRKCGSTFEASAGQIRRGDYICPPCRREYQNEWCRQRNAKLGKTKKRLTEDDRRRYRAHRKQVKYHNNLAHYHEIQRRRRRWLAQGDVTKQELIAIYTAANGKCHYCGVLVKCRFSPKDSRGFDHVVPRSQGGRHTASNIVVCCFRCNTVKSDKPHAAPKLA